MFDVYKDTHIFLQEKKKSKRRTLLFLRLSGFFSVPMYAHRLRLRRCAERVEVFFQGKRKSQRQMASRGADVCFFWVFDPFSLRKICVFFFQRKRKSQRMMTSEECMYLPFRRSSSFFFLFFPFIYTHRHNPFRLRLILPGWCLNQLRGGGLRSLLVCGKGHAVFFQRKEESKRRVALGEYRHPLFRRLSIFFFFFKDFAPLGVQGTFDSSLAGRQCFLFGEKEAKQRADNCPGVSFAFSAASCFSFSFF